MAHLTETDLTAAELAQIDADVNAALARPQPVVPVVPVEPIVPPIPPTHEIKYLKYKSKYLKLKKYLINFN